MHLLSSVVEESLSSLVLPKTKSSTAQFCCRFDVMFCKFWKGLCVTLNETVWVAVLEKERLPLLVKVRKFPLLMPKFKVEEFTMLRDIFCASVLS